MDLQEKVLEVMINRAAEVLKKGVEDFSGNTSFESLEMKSAQYVQITTVLEDEYDVEIPYMDFKRKKTMNEAAEYVVQLIEG